MPVIHYRFEGGMLDPEDLLLPAGKNRRIGSERVVGRRSDNGVVRYVSPHGSSRYVAYRNRRPVAALQVVSADGRTAQIATVYTHPEERRKGWATKLLARSRRDFQSVKHAPEKDLSVDGRAWRDAVGESATIDPMAKRKKTPQASDRERDATTVPPKGDAKVVVGAGYEATVYQTLEKLGASSPGPMIHAAGDFVRNCQAAGVDAKVCATTLYGSERHRHEVSRTTINEAAESVAQSPTREEWEVLVRRTGSIDKIKDAAGRKPDEITHVNVVFGDFFDDEKAQRFARKMTSAGFVAWYGPRRQIAAAEGRGAMDAYSIVRQNERASGLAYVPDVVREMNVANGWTIEQAHRSLLQMHKSGVIELRPGDVFSDDAKLALPGPQGSKLVWIRVVEGATEGDPSALGETPAAAEMAPVIAEPTASELTPVIAEGHIPWRKVARDPAQAEADMALAERYGAIKTPQKVYEVVGAELAEEDAEVFLVIPLNLRGELKCAPIEVARGQRSKVSVGVEDVMRAVIASGCEGYVVAHNHPSGRCHPSKADLQLTDQIRAATKPFGSGVKFLDHVVIAQKRCYSIVENRLYKIR